MVKADAAVEPAAAKEKEAAAAAEPSDFTPFPVVVPLESLTSPSKAPVEMVPASGGRQTRATRAAAAAAARATSKPLEEDDDEEEEMAAKASSLHLTPPKPTYNGPMLPIESAHDHLPDGVVEVERVLATRSSSSRHHGTTTMEWLIKWRGCPYAEATWEVYGSFVFDAGVYAAYKLAQVHPAKQSKAQPSLAKPSTAKPSTASTAQLSSTLTTRTHTHPLSARSAGAHAGEPDPSEAHRIDRPQALPLQAVEGLREGRWADPERVPA